MGFLDRLRGGSDYVDDPSLSDDEWLRHGRSRYEKHVPNHYGSPETLAEEGNRRLQQGDMAAALFFFQKAIDLLDTLYGYSRSANREPGPRDEPIVKAYMVTLGQVLGKRPTAPVDESIQEVSGQLRRIASMAHDAGLDAGSYERGLQQLARIKEAFGS